MPALKLCSANISALAQQSVDGAALDVPRYPRQLRQRICHIGIGRFHRAHQAHYLHRLLQQNPEAGWGLCGIALRPEDRGVLAALQAQDGLYSLWEMDGQQRRVSVIGSLMQWVDAGEDSAPALAILSDAATRIISLTVTESGYCLNASGNLDLQHPDIVHDLARPRALHSAPGLIVAALVLRRAAGGGGLTLLSCDNLIENGKALRRAVLQFAQAMDGALAQWIEAEVSFPCSMVDRITPAPSAMQSRQACTGAGFEDAVPILCEDWCQWVLEDQFAAGRPAWQQVGATFSNDVAAYERMKVGLLNGAHSALSHVGLLLGYERVHEALELPLLQRWLQRYMEAVAGRLAPISGVSYANYQDSLLRRFRNPAIEDRLTRLAQDSSAKLQQTLLPLLRACLKEGNVPPVLTAVLAFWLLYLAGQPSDYLDPRRSELLDAAQAAMHSGDSAPFLAAALSITAAEAQILAPVIARQAVEIKAVGQIRFLEQLLQV